MRSKNSQMLTTNGCIGSNYGCIGSNFWITPLNIKQITKKKGIYDVNYILQVENIPKLPF